MVVDFTEQEIAILRHLLHRACLQGGMEVAEAAVVISKKLQAAQKQQPVISRVPLAVAE